MAQKIFFQSGDYQIEGLWNQRPGDSGVVVSHPHPIYGGDMHAAVVESIAHVYWKMGYTTLKFNFRGVGNSQGRYEDGIGEQQDVRAAVSWLHKTGIKQIDLAGYSFGAWVNAHAINQELPVKRMVLVSPPVAFMDFKNVSDLDRLKLVVTGSLDMIAPPGPIQKMLPSWNPEARLEIVEGADHFYGGYLNHLESALENSL